MLFIFAHGLNLSNGKVIILLELGHAYSWSAICAYQRLIRNDRRQSFVSPIVLARLGSSIIHMAMPGKEGVYLGFWKANDLGRDFDERQATSLHQSVDGSFADVQAPGQLGLGFVIRRRDEFVVLWVHAVAPSLACTLPSGWQAMMHQIHRIVSRNRMTQKSPRAET